jgi:hypothetical protein
MMSPFINVISDSKYNFQTISKRYRSLGDFNKNIRTKQNHKFFNMYDLCKIRISFSPTLHFGMH